MKYPDVPNYLDGSFVGGDLPFLDVYNPSDGSVISRVPLSTHATMSTRAVAERKGAFPAWSATPIKERVQVFYRYKALLEQNIDELAALVTEENGKIASEARAEVLKSAELCEFACSLPQIAPGEVLEVSRGVECRVERYPARRRRVDHAVQLPEHGAELDDPERDRARQLHDPQAVGARAARAPAASPSCCARRDLPEGVLQVVHGGQGSGRGDLRSSRHRRRSASSARRKIAKIVYRRAHREPQARASRSAARRITSS